MTTLVPVMHIDGVQHMGRYAGDGGKTNHFKTMCEIINSTIGTVHKIAQEATKENHTEMVYI